VPEKINEFAPTGFGVIAIFRKLTPILLKHTTIK
jgi:hypothetical protein